MDDSEEFEHDDCHGGEPASTESENKENECRCDTIWSKWAISREKKNISRSRPCESCTETEEKLCLTQGCPIWSAWSPWVGINETNLARGRNCLNEIILDSILKTCPGRDEEYKLRPVDKWTEWTTWDSSDEIMPWFQERSRACKIMGCTDFELENRFVTV